MGTRKIKIKGGNQDKMEIGDKIGDFKDRDIQGHHLLIKDRNEVQVLPKVLQSG